MKSVNLSICSFVCLMEMLIVRDTIEIVIRTLECLSYFYIQTVQCKETYFILPFIIW